jgi:hypothetical protein
MFFSLEFLYACRHDDRRPPGRAHSHARVTAPARAGTDFVAAR